MSTNRKFEVIAGSSYGRTTSTYELVDGVLYLLEPGNSLGLVGNAEALGFDGLILNQAKKRVSEINADFNNNDHGIFCGCHACSYSIRIKEVTEMEQETELDFHNPIRLKGKGLDMRVLQDC